VPTEELVRRCEEKLAAYRAAHPVSPLDGMSTVQMVEYLERKIRASHAERHRCSAGAPSRVRSPAEGS
jgi:hypothetical protein